MKRLIGLSFDSEGSDEIASSPSTDTVTVHHCRPLIRISLLYRSVTSPQRTASFDTIDFRTGMSGHRGALSSRTSDPRATPRRNIRMMSSHMGIGRIRCTPPTKPKATGTTYGKKRDCCIGKRTTYYMHDYFKKASCRTVYSEYMYCELLDESPIMINRTVNLLNITRCALACY